MQKSLQGFPDPGAFSSYRQESWGQPGSSLPLRQGASSLTKSAGPVAPGTGCMFSHTFLWPGQEVSLWCPETQHFLQVHCAGSVPVCRRWYQICVPCRPTLTRVACQKPTPSAKSPCPKEPLLESVTCESITGQERGELCMKKPGARAIAQ